MRTLLAVLAFSLVSSAASAQGLKSFNVAPSPDTALLPPWENQWGICWPQVALSVGASTGQAGGEGMWAGFTADGNPAFYSVCTMGAPSGGAVVGIADDTHSLVEQTTSATINSEAYTLSGTNNLSIIRTVRTHYALGATITTIRAVGAGIQTTGALLTTAAPVERNAYTRFDTATDGTTWRACSADGTTHSCTNMAVTASAATVQEHKVINNCTSVTFCIASTCVTKSTNLPGCSNAVVANAIQGIKALAASDRAFRSPYLYGGRR